MIPSILLALTVIVVMIDVLVGIHRGFGFGVVRLLIWVAGSVICAMFARSFTVWVLLKLAKVPNLNMFAFDMFGTVFSGDTAPIGTHLTGTIVSFAVPIVFVVLFLAAKFVTWLIYCIVKILIKKAARRTEAFNAAVDAVKSIQSSEQAEAEKSSTPPIPQPSFREEKKDDFGTFGIYPKEQPKGSDGADENVVASSSLDNTADEGDGQTDGFEALSAKETDGFESLAKSLRLEGADDAPPIKQKKPRMLRKRHSIAKLIVNNSVLSSVLGGILGMVVAIYALAIIYSPISEISKILREENAAESTVDLFATTTDASLDELINGAFSHDAKRMARTDRDFSITSDLSLRTDDFVEAINSQEDSIVYNIFKYSGAGCLASSIYNGLTPVNGKDIGLDDSGMAEYNFPDTLRCYLYLMQPADDMMDYMCSGKGFTEELLDKLENLFDLVLKDVGKGGILTLDDKLALVNSAVKKMNDRMLETPILGENGVHIDPFPDYANAVKGLKDCFEYVRRFVRAGIL